MNVLIVDDDSGARALMRRVLVRDFHANVVEADDGVTGLERLLAEPIDLLLLDVKMRVMDGLRTLEAVRRSPKYGALKVVMMTGMADQERVARAMELGVTDFLVKPFTQSMLRERLGRLIDVAHAATESSATPRLDLTATDRVIVLDGDAAFRDFFASAFTLCRVEQADSEFTVLKQCETGPLAALFVGTIPGLLDWQVFVQTLRSLPHATRLPVIAAARSAELEQARSSGAYDAVIVRSFDAGSFTRSLAAVINEAGLARMLFGPTSPCVTTLFESACALVGEPLGQSIAIGGHDRLQTSGAARWLFGSLSMHCAQMTWELRLHLPFAVALKTATAPPRLDADKVSESQVIASTGELTKQLGAVLCDEVMKHGLKPRLSTVRAGALPSTRPLTSVDPSSVAARCLLGANDETVGVIHLVRHGALQADHLGGR